MTDNIFDRPGTPAHYCPGYLYDWIERPGYMERFPNELEGDLKMPDRWWDAEDYDARYRNG